MMFLTQSSQRFTKVHKASVILCVPLWPSCEVFP
jgi:hypothetical protein